MSTSLRLVGLTVLGILATVPRGSAQTVLYQNNFNSNDGGLSVTNVAGTGFTTAWAHSLSNGVGGTGGWFTNGQLNENSVANTTNLTTASLPVTVTGPVTVSFDHRHSFEDGGGNWDGGALFFSVNGGAFNPVPNANFTANGPNGTVISGSLSTLANQAAWVGTSAGYANPSFLTSSAGLGTLNSGDTLQIRWVAAYDSNTQGPNLPNWEIDNVIITVVPEPTSMALVGVVVAGAAFYRRRKLI